MTFDATLDVCTPHHPICALHAVDSGVEQKHWTVNNPKLLGLGRLAWVSTLSVGYLLQWPVIISNRILLFKTQ